MVFRGPGLLPEFPVTGDLTPMDLKDFSETGLDECLNFLHCCSHSYLCFSSTEQDRLYSGVKIKEAEGENNGKATSESGLALHGTSNCGMLRTARSGGSWL